jgi:acyl-CoA reductase-like NAD-dependent aldehyde dehydrogenase
VFVVRGCPGSAVVLFSGIAIMQDVEHQIAALVIGASWWAGNGPQARGELAARTALSTAAATDAWIDAAVAIERSTDPAVRAEETATGPLATLRLLLVTARALADIGRTGLPWIARLPRLVHGGGGVAWVEVDAIPCRGPHGSLHDGAVFGGHRATVRCASPGGLDAFERSWREEVARRPRTGGVALVLGAGNVTGLAPADCISQIFEYGRTVLLKLHPLHAPLLPILRAAFAPLVDAGLLVIVAGGAEVARRVLAAPGLDHVHLTGGEGAFDALVWGGRPRHGAPALVQTISCELGNVTPWIVVPGRYTRRELAMQADAIVASVVNNASCNCIATKLVVTAGSWPQRGEFLELVQRRFAAVPPRLAWYPGSVAAWETVTESSAPSDGTLPWTFRTGVDPDHDPRFVQREWFAPVVAEIPLEADSLEAFATAVRGLVERLPGSLAASVTLPGGLAARDAARAELLVEHLPFGVVAVNTWAAIGYSMGSVPWGGFPGGTLEAPRSGIGRVHDPLLLPLVHNTIVRGPLAPWPRPSWFAWHPHGATLARGLVDVYAEIAGGRSGLWPLARMVPQVLTPGS